MYNNIISPDAPSLGLIDDEDWEKTKAMRRILNAFLKPTEHLSGSYYPTSNCVLPHLVEIMAMLKRYEYADALHSTVEAMTRKLRDYFVPIPPLFYIATMVDPQWKIEGTLPLLVDFYQSCDIADPVTQAEMYYQEMLGLLKDLYRYHRSQDLAQTNRPTTSSHSSGMFKKRCQITQGIGTSRTATNESFSDLLVYEGQDGDYDVDDEFAVLKWWKENARSMPVLSLVARDLLAAPASTVSSESAFSSGGQVINIHRHSLKPETVEACICLKDWRDAEVR